jgi:hypothetical protein
MEPFEHFSPDSDLGMPKVPGMLAAEPGPLGKVPNRGDAVVVYPFA